MIYGAGMRYRRKFSTHMQLFAKALGSQTTCRKHCYKATFFFFFFRVIYQKRKTNDLLSLGRAKY